MVPPVNHIKTAQEKLFFLKQNLTCSNYGIYAAQCQICQKIYVGQTINHFSTRWSGHRAFWNNNNAKKQHNDRASLLIHFQTWHQKLMNSLPDISDCFEVTFLQEPRNQQKLDVLESMWINKLVAEININKTILPKYHQFCIGLLFFWFAFIIICCNNIGILLQHILLQNNFHIVYVSI